MPNFLLQKQKPFEESFALKATLRVNIDYCEKSRRGGIGRRCGFKISELRLSQFSVALQNVALSTIQSPDFRIALHSEA